MQKIDHNKILSLVDQIKANDLVYNDLPLDEFEGHVVRLLKRLHVQKALFIKEINRLFDVGAFEGNTGSKRVIATKNEHLVKKYEYALANGEQSGCIALVIEIEHVLHEMYHSVLFNEQLDEIARMILSNQSNEINRDIRGLKSMYEYA